MALLHLTFYVPLACIRVAALMATSMAAPIEVSLALTGASFVCYVFSAPVHLVNFVVRYVRVPSFARASRRAILFIICPWANGLGFGGNGIRASLAQSTSEIV